MWFQNRRARFRKMPLLSPVKSLGGSTHTSNAITDGTNSIVRQPRTFSPIVIQPRASSSDSSARSTPSPRPSTGIKTSTPAVGDRSFQPLNISNSSTESCDENLPPKKTEVKNKDEYKTMTMTTLPPDHPFCKLTHSSSTGSKRKAVRDNVMSLHEPPRKMAIREPMSSFSAFKSAKRRSSQYGAQQAPSPGTLNQLPVGFIPAWPASLPLASAFTPPANSDNNKSTKNNNNVSTNKKDSGSPLDLSKKPVKSEDPENVKEENKKKDDEPTVTETRRQPTKDIRPHPHTVPATGTVPMIPPYFGFPLMGMPTHVNPFMPPTGTGVTPFMVPMFAGAYPGVYSNPSTLWAHHSAPSNAQKSS